ncbi:MAG TPA: pseudouridine synthase [Methylomirabilota bacterium]|nr:pseudouridine synthase [Methylomirabilota bacterium]
MVRLQKFLAEAGVASRRASELVIREGRVTVNGQTITELGTKIDPACDKVSVDGRSLKPRRKLYVALHKPAGYICTRRDPESRKIISELLPAEWSNLVPVGRLDCASEGLIFLTNDGDFCLKLTHPRYGVRKKYRVTIEGHVDQEITGKLVKGMVHEGDRLKAERVRILVTNNSTSLLEIELAEGKNRELRRMFEVLGRNIIKLQRVQIGPIKLGELRAGRWRTLTATEIKSLLGGL